MHCALSAAAVVGGVGRPAGAWQHASSPCMHVLHTCAESNTIAVLKNKFIPYMVYEYLPAHPQIPNWLPPSSHQAKLQVMYQAPGLATVLKNKYIPSCMVHRRRIRKKIPNWLPARAAAVVDGVGGPAGAWQHASSPCIHVLHTCAESNKIAVLKNNFIPYMV